MQTRLHRRNWFSFCDLADIALCLKLIDLLIRQRLSCFVLKDSSYSKAGFVKGPVVRYVSRPYDGSIITSSVLHVCRIPEAND